jgi:hypothetical protein
MGACGICFNRWQYFGGSLDDLLIGKSSRKYSAIKKNLL